MVQTDLMETCKNKYGLTLIEMLVALVIVIVLATTVISLTARIDNQSKERGLNSTYALLEGAIEQYYDYWDAFPDPNNTLYPTHSAALYGQLYKTPSSKKLLEQISDTLLKDVPDAPGVVQIYDPWGTVLDYRYVQGDAFPEIISAGPDKILGTADDITNR
jgi:prepilin-type N-terminal cleavage/methylation domain-containing protein